LGIEGGKVDISFTLLAAQQAQKQQAAAQDEWDQGQQSQQSKKTLVGVGVRIRAGIGGRHERSGSTTGNRWGLVQPLLAQDGSNIGIWDTRGIENPANNILSNIGSTDIGSCLGGKRSNTGSRLKLEALLDNNLQEGTLGNDIAVEAETVDSGGSLGKVAHLDNRSVGASSTAGPCGAGTLNLNQTSPWHVRAGSSKVGGNG
jgi:hypothetical protein